MEEADKDKALRLMAASLIADGKVEIANEAYDKAKATGEEDTVTVRAIPNGLDFSWCRKTAGFGHLTLMARDGKLYVDRETMSVLFCMGVLGQALREAEKL